MSNPTTNKAPVKTTAVTIASLQPNQCVTPRDMRGIADQIMPVLMKSLPAQYQKSASRYAHALVNEMMKNPSLAEATGLSLLGCLMQAATLGLEIGSTLGHAYPVPYYDSKKGCKIAQLQVGYKGFIALAGRSDKVAAFDAHIVYANDTFEIDLGSSPRVVHKPSMKEARKDPIGYYAVLKTNVNGTQVRFMNQADMLAFRQRFVKASTAWDSNFPEMGRKTVLRSLAKYVPISPELTTAATLDEMQELDLDQGLSSLGQLVMDEAGAPPGPTQTENQVLNDMGGGNDQQEEPGSNG